MNLEELCANCGEKQKEFEVESYEDLTYIISECNSCEYVNRTKTDHILQITTF